MVAGSEFPMKRLYGNVRRGHYHSPHRRLLYPVPSETCMNHVHDSFRAFMESTVLPHRDAHPDWLRLDGAPSGGNWEVFGRFRLDDRVWRVHSDSHLRPLLAALEAIRAGESNPFVVAPTRRGDRLDLKTEIAQKAGGRFRHLYMYSDGPAPSAEAPIRFTLTGKGGDSIRTIDEWRAHAPPKSAGQWQPGRSAVEMAEAWCASGPCVPADVRALLDSHPLTRGATLISGTPEAQIHFDDIPGEPRNADLALLAEGEDGLIAITVEGKADETFGEYVGDVMADGIDREIESGSRAVERVRGLAKSLLPKRSAGERPLPPLRNLRYQLLTATAGTLAWASDSNAAFAVLIVHVFDTDRTEPERHALNARDLDLFVQRISGGAVRSIADGEMAGPFELPGTPLFEAGARVLIGKVVTRRRIQAIGS